MKKKLSPFDECSWCVCLRRQNKPKKMSACLSVWTCTNKSFCYSTLRESSWKDSVIFLIFTICLINHKIWLSQHFASRTYARFPEVESGSGIRTHHTAQTSPTLRDGSCSRNSKNYFTHVTFNYFYSDSRKVPIIKADVLTPVSSIQLVYSWCIQLKFFVPRMKQIPLMW